MKLKKCSIIVFERTIEINKRPMGLGALVENQLGHWQKGPEVVHALSFYRRGSILSLFLSLYRRIFTITILGNET